MEIALTALSIMSISLLIGLISATKKLKNMSEGFASLFLAYNVLQQTQEEVAKGEGDVHKENFIKFLSDSREWAFGYIEEVQAGLKKFIEEVEPDITYYDSYGIAIEGMVAPHDNALKKISKEFKELKKLLPEEPSDRC